MGMLDVFKFKATGGTLKSELPAIYSLGLAQSIFTDSDIRGIYTKILTDCVDRTHGITDQVNAALWDNCMMSEADKGLVSLLADTMTSMGELYLVYESATGVLRKATNAEMTQIREDYKKSAKSSAGVYISFKNFQKTQMLRVYSAMEYVVLCSLNKIVSLSNAIQIKMADMRQSVGAIDSKQIIDQARDVARALGNGSDIVIDSGDEITTSTIDMGPTEKAIAFLDSKRAFVLNLPLSYITGEQTPGIGSTGEADTKAVERGLRPYWTSIIRPVLKDLFGLTTTFRSHDFRQMGTALETLKSFELVSEDLIDIDSKRLIIAKMFDVDMVKGEPKSANQEQDTGGMNDDKPPANAAS